MASNGFHTHPVTLLFKLRYFLVLLLLPLLRGFYQAILHGSIHRWFVGSQFDLFLLVGILCWVLFSWKAERVFLQDNVLIHKKGLIRRRENFIAGGQITSANCSHPFLLRPFSCVQVRISVNGSHPRIPAFSCYLQKKSAAMVLQLTAREQGESVAISHQPSSLSLALLAAALSNTMGGTVLLITFISQVGHMASETLQQRLVEQVSLLLRFLERFLPSAFTLLILLLALSWIFAFFQNLIRYLRFSAQREGKILFIQGGLLTQRESWILVPKINYIDIRQNLFTRLFHISTVLVHCTGYGKRGDLNSVLIPSTTPNIWKKMINQILPEYKRPSRALRVKRLNCCGRLLFPSLLAGIAAVFFGFFLYVNLPTWGRFIKAFTLLLVCLFLWMFFVQLTNALICGVGEDEKSYSIWTASLFQLHCFVIKKEKMTTISLTQNPFQRWNDVCTLSLRPFSENRRCFFLSNVDRVEALCFLHRESDLRKEDWERLAKEGRDPEIVRESLRETGALSGKEYYKNRHEWYHRRKGKSPKEQ